MVELEIVGGHQSKMVEVKIVRGHQRKIVEVRILKIKRDLMSPVKKKMMTMKKIMSLIVARKSRKKKIMITKTLMNK